MTLPLRSRPRVVLVHGAFGTAASWLCFVPMLEDRGLSVIPARCPQASFSTDVAAVWSICDEEDGGVLLVAHSWDGAVITEACRHPRVRGAVYIASGSDNQEALGEWLAEFPAMGSALAPDDPPATGTTWTWKSKPTWFIYGEQGERFGPGGVPMPAQLAEVADVIAQAAAELAGQGPAQAPRR
jgi:pimeloyl-ACP methyl ester carboxylesterase